MTILEQAVYGESTHQAVNAARDYLAEQQEPELPFDVSPFANENYRPKNKSVKIRLEQQGFAAICTLLSLLNAEEKSRMASALQRLRTFSSPYAIGVWNGIRAVGSASGTGKRNA